MTKIENPEQPESRNAMLARQAEVILGEEQALRKMFNRIPSAEAVVSKDQVVQFRDLREKAVKEIWVAREALSRWQCPTIDRLRENLASEEEGLLKVSYLKETSGLYARFHKETITKDFDQLFYNVHHVSGDNTKYPLPDRAQLLEAIQPMEEAMNTIIELEKLHEKMRQETKEKQREAILEKQGPHSRNMQTEVLGVARNAASTAGVRIAKKEDVNDVMLAGSTRGLCYLATDINNLAGSSNGTAEHFLARLDMVVEEARKEREEAEKEIKMKKPTVTREETLQSAEVPQQRNVLGWLLGKRKN
jgi:hypothetical protein